MLCNLSCLLSAPSTHSIRKILNKDWRAGKENEDQIAARISEPQMCLEKSPQPPLLCLYMPGTMPHGHQAIATIASVAGNSVFLQLMARNGSFYTPTSLY